MAEARRVVVTGLGAIAPTGINVADFWRASIAGKSGIREITRFGLEGYSSRIAGEVDFDPEIYLSTKEIRQNDRFTQFAIACSIEALKDSGLEINEDIAERVGAIIGSGIGGLQTMETQHKALLNSGPRKVSPYMVPMMITNMAAGLVSIKTGAKGTNFCTVSACASSAHAIGEAFKAVQRGDLDAAIAGGSEAPITPLGVAGFCSIRALSTGKNDNPTKASRPFDKDRDGFVIAEGAGVLILEELEFARKRNARIYAEVRGYGSTADAYHIVQPAPGGEGAARAMKMALADAKTDPSSVDYINAHGTSTPLNDKLETEAVKNVFGKHAYNLVMSSTKSMTGHLLGAAGGIEAVLSAKAIDENIVPPTINLDEPGEGCDLNYAPHEAVQKKVDCVMSNSLGFGGQNACLVFRRL